MWDVAQHKEAIELVLLLVVTADRVWRWKFSREANDVRLGERVSTLEEGQDDKVDAAVVQALDDEVARLRTDFKNEVNAVTNRFHGKLGEVNVNLGRLATTRDVDLLRRELEQLRQRVDGHIDRDRPSH